MRISYLGRGDEANPEMDRIAITGGGVLRHGETASRETTGMREGSSEYR